MSVPLTAGALRADLGDLVRLAWPVVITRLGIMTMITADTVVVGQFSAGELASLGLASIPAGLLAVVGIGLLTGTLVMTAHALGAGDPAECGRVFRRSLPYAVWLGVGLAGLTLLGEPFFALAGQDPAVAAGAVPVLMVFGLGTPFLMVMVVCTLFLEALKRPLPGMLAIVAANLLNLLLDLVLVQGWFGLPALGAIGSAWATTGSRLFMAAVLLAVVWWMPDRERFGIRTPAPGWWHAGRPARQLGYAEGAARGIEYTAFGMVGLFAGLLGALPLGAYTILLNLLSLPFMAALGLAIATAVRVGAAWGSGDRCGAARAGWLGLAATSALTGLVSLAFLLLGPEIAALYTEDPALLALTAPLVAFCATILVADGGQVLMSNALRGRGDTWMPTALQFLAYFCVQIPLAAWLALACERGVRGLLEGILAAAVVAMAGLAARFWWLARHDRRRRPVPV